MCRLSCSESAFCLHEDAVKLLTPGRGEVAGENLPENEEQRPRKRKIDEGGSINGSGTRFRSRSLSSSSSTSISTISTKISHSPTPSPEQAGLSRNWTSTRSPELGKRQRRFSSSSRSYSSEASSRRPENVRPRDNSRNTRRRRCSTSPESRGRERHHHNIAINDPPDHDRNSGRISRSSSILSASESSLNQRHRYRSEYGQRQGRKRQSSTSPASQTRGQKSQNKKSRRRTRSGSVSKGRSEGIRSRRSISPKDRLRQDDKHLDSSRNRRPPISYDTDRYGSGFRGSDRVESRHTMSARSVQPPRKERSLSPFSKRLALTQAMNMGK